MPFAMLRIFPSALWSRGRIVEKFSFCALALCLAPLALSTSAQDLTGAVDTQLQLSRAAHPTNSLRFPGTSRHYSVVNRVGSKRGPGRSKCCMTFT